jgi:hypothetical protein
MAASAIQQQVIKQTRRLSSLRSQLFYTLKTTYSHIRDENDWESKLMKEIKIQDGDTMANLIKKVRNKKVA